MALWDNSATADKCTGCGSNIYFDEKCQKLICRNCGSFFDPTTKELEYQLEVKDKGEADAFDSRVEFTCDSCGAVVITDDTTASTICAFCGSPALVKGRLRNEFKPDVIIPFKIGRKEAEKAFKNWASDYKKTPKNFSSGAVKKMQGVYVPFWLIDGNCCLAYKHDYVETREYDFKLRNVPFDGSHSIPDGLMRAIEPFDYDDLVPYHDGYLHGYFAKRYDESIVDITDKVYGRLHNYLDSVYSKMTENDSNEFRNVEYSYIRDLSQQYALLPVWFINYEYDGTNYQYAINGQTGEVQGFDVPYSKLHYGKEYAKKIAAIGTIAAIILAILGFAIYYVGGVVVESVQIASLGGNVFVFSTLLFFLFCLVPPSVIMFLIIKNILWPIAVREFKKPVYHIIDDAPEAFQYVDISTIEKVKK